MFTLSQIENAHSKVKSGADFPNYIQEIKQLGVVAFETWVNDSHTVYFGNANYQIQSTGKYNLLSISSESKVEAFKNCLKIHQNGETDYFMFCQHCAETGIEKWIVSLTEMTCTYFDVEGNEILIEQIPG